MDGQPNCELQICFVRVQIFESRREHRYHRQLAIGLVGHHRKTNRYLKSLMRKPVGEKKRRGELK